MVQEDINIPVEMVDQKDDVIVDWKQSTEVWAEISDVTTKVRRLNPFKVVFWFDTIGWGNEVTRLEQLRSAAANDNYPSIISEEIEKKAA